MRRDATDQQEAEIILNEMHDSVPPMPVFKKPWVSVAVPRFETRKLKRASSIAVVGRSHSDCVYIARKMIELWNSELQSIRVISPSPFASQDFEAPFSVKIQNKLKLQTPQLESQLSKLMSHGSALIIDECCDSSTMSTTNLVELVKNAKSGKCILIPSNAVNLKEFYNNLQYCFLLRENVYRQQQILWRLFGAAYPLNQFIDILDRYTANLSCLVLDLKAKRLYRLK